MSNENQTPPANVDQSAPALAPVPLLGSFFFPHFVRGPDIIARTVMRSPWPAGQWVETRDESGTLVEISCSPPCWFELLPNDAMSHERSELAP
jgi:hypothetical protein